MDLKITGTVKQVLEEQSGEGRNGPWRKQEFILETDGNYPKQICILQWGDNIEAFAVQPDEYLTVSVDIQSREFNGRWYTDVKAWKVEREEAGTPRPTPQGTEGFPEPSTPGDGEDDDLPF